MSVSSYSVGTNGEMSTASNSSVGRVFPAITVDRRNSTVSSSSGGDAFEDGERGIRLKRVRQRKNSPTRKVDDSYQEVKKRLANLHTSTEASVTATQVPEKADKGSNTISVQTSLTDLSIAPAQTPVQTLLSCSVGTQYDPPVQNPSENIITAVTSDTGTPSASQRIPLEPEIHVVAPAPSSSSQESGSVPSAFPRLLPSLRRSGPVVELHNTGRRGAVMLDEAALIIARGAVVTPPGFASISLSPPLVDTSSTS